MAEQKTPQQILEEAREIIERDGWHQGSYYADNGNPEDPFTAPVCAIGALRRAALGTAVGGSSGISGERWNTFLKARGALMSTVGYFSIPEWNDNPSRSREDVILAFKQAAHG